ncbi:MAG TPA: hypothetical protein P5305_01245 [Rubrivivax sp.]|nr:hypothetical protein [Rubrivivax sp.]HRY86477.1 hypothetical protein [Rubrivivax sp.]
MFSRQSFSAHSFNPGSWHFSYDDSAGAPTPPWVARGSYDPGGDEGERQHFIHQQNRSFITLLMGLAAAGAFDD